MIEFLVLRPPYSLILLLGRNENWFYLEKEIEQKTGTRTREVCNKEPPFQHSMIYNSCIFSFDRSSLRYNVPELVPCQIWAL